MTQSVEPPATALASRARDAGGTAAPALAPPPARHGAWTTLHVATYRRASTAVRIMRFATPTPLEAWCNGNGVDEAIVGGFFVRANGVPLGEVRTGGIVRTTVAFTKPWDERRACVHADGGRVAIARRPDLPAQPRGDLLQAGPLLVHNGAPCVHGDPEGFSAAPEQFDSDITAGRYPRAALAVGRRGRLLAVAADGRAPDDAGLTLEELAEALVALGATQAINLDGGGSTSLVCGGALRNVPREGDGAPIPGGRPVATALVFTAR